MEASLKNHLSSPSTAAVRVLFFSVLREKLDRRSLDLEVSGLTTAREILDELTKRYPVLEPYRSGIRVAVNQSYVDEGQTVRGGDEVALITPVSGG